MKRVKASMLVEDVLELDESIDQVLYANGLPCMGCAGAANETLAEAAESHGADLGRLIEELNQYLNQTQAKENEKE